MDATTNEVRTGRGYSLVEDDPRQIKGQIDRTRAHMDETIDAISSRLSPRRLIDEFLDMFTGRRVVVQGDVETTGGEYHAVQEVSGGDLIHAVRKNPVPAALIGAGVAYYLYNRNRSRARMHSGADVEVGGYGERDWLAPGATYESSSGGGVGHKVGSAVGRIKDKVGEKAHDLGERAMHSARDKAGSAMHSLQEKAGEAMHAVGERAGHAMSSAAGSTGRGMMDAARSAGHTISGVAHSAKNRMAISPERREHMKHRARDMAYGVRDTVEEHPLLFGGAALLVGLVAGLSAPPTRTERRVIGPIRDDLVDEVRHRAGDASESVGETLREVGKAAGQAAAGKASEENAGGIAQRAASAATAAVHTAGEKLREKIPKESDDGRLSNQESQSAQRQAFSAQSPAGSGGPGSGSPGGRPFGQNDPSAKPAGTDFQSDRNDNQSGNQKR